MDPLNCVVEIGQPEHQRMRRQGQVNGWRRAINKDFRSDHVMSSTYCGDLSSGGKTIDLSQFDALSSDSAKVAHYP
jgi:hypothetical protein